MKRSAVLPRSSLSRRYYYGTVASADVLLPIASLTVIVALPFAIEFTLNCEALAPAVTVAIAVLLLVAVHATVPGSVTVMTIVCGCVVKVIGLGVKLRILRM
jgi:hypothetical protein